MRLRVEGFHYRRSRGTARIKRRDDHTRGRADVSGGFVCCFSSRRDKVIRRDTDNERPLDYRDINYALPIAAVYACSSSHRRY
jgi:hypothetical protein